LGMGWLLERGSRSSKTCTRGSAVNCKVGGLAGAGHDRLRDGGGSADVWNE
jgi:hypothetical protein